MSRGGLVVFLGPSLPAREARRIARCTVLPPARQGDVWRALTRRPAALALVDGVFESVPSVWHHELLDALHAGVAVFGGGSMGALRAAELSGRGMVGVGRVFGWYRDGLLRGDDEVALLHAGPELGFRALTLPLVTVRATAELARGRRLLSAREASALVAAAAAIFYQERTWRAVLAAAAPRLRPRARAALQALVRAGAPDPKAEDARATIAAAAAFVRGGASLAPAGDPPRPSSLVRRRKLSGALAVARGAAIPAGEVLARVGAQARAAALRDDGLRRALLAGFARALGLAASPAERGAAADAFFAARRIRRGGREAALAALALDGADARRLFDDLALERLLLDAAARAVPDGPSPDEGLALGARLSGDFARAAEELARRPRRAGRRRSR
ncbi:TfuA-like protein [Anaeromyxobacter diazotrophicus]|uniref:TfuA-like core domain-containing protein n=1 Tax=Anaeromyxobacter diazotrophicus TaxID=2590199 RepID=A0A7I9VG11_9BACT|nr:TfuA-like protein [Anaeromyxobacter diazotrophicus]GEJ55331.1 hypothetical protein AMYX_00720 [Anaeromyxobacter diazotrophicus]